MAEDPGESFVIETLIREAARAGGYRPRLGAGDDAAWLRSGEVVTTDTMVEGVHFDAQLSPEDVGWKLVAVNASDVGAMGARPTWALLNLCLPRPLDRGWVSAFAAGLAAAMRAWEITLVGGDTTRSPGPVFASLTLAGQTDQPVTRSGARPGDAIWVTGALGEAAAGFLGVDGLRPPSGLAWLRRPHPPVALGASLGERGLVTAMMDLSDGLSMDLPRLCAASGVGAQIDPARLPLGPALRAARAPLPYQVAFGDDYQLLFTADPAREDALRTTATGHGVDLTKIGVVTLDRSVKLMGQDWPARAFAHFQEEPSRAEAAAGAVP